MSNLIYNGKKLEELTKQESAKLIMELYELIPDGESLDTRNEQVIECPHCNQAFVESIDKWVAKDIEALRRFKGKFQRIE